MNIIEEFIYLQEVNRIVQGLSNRMGKPKDHVQAIWKETEKEMVLKHKYGVTDKYKAIGRIVKAKLGEKPDKPDPVTDDGSEEETK